MIYCVLVVLLSIFCICVIIKVVFKLTNGHNGSYTCLIGKTAIVTGSNTGIGFYTAQDFASRGAKVILACRNQEKAEKTKRTIINNTGNPNIFVELVDFASLASVRNFALRINTQEDRLDILVNNAGVIVSKDTTTEDGLSMSMQTNYLGPFLLTTLLMDLLKKTENSRIVNVSSVAAKVAKLNPDKLHKVNNSFTSTIFHYNYCNTKLCIILWTNELARRLKGTSVTANSINPGSICTKIFQHTSTFEIGVIKFANLFCLKNLQEGAQTSIYAAISKDLQNISGQYINNCKIVAQPKSALDTVLAQKVWRNSEDLVNLTKAERVI